MKISIIGASGTIGRALFSQLSKHVSLSDTEIVLVCHSRKSLLTCQGMLNDALLGSFSKQIWATSNINDIVDSNICVICAGTPISNNPITNNREINNRNTVFEENRIIVKPIIQSINRYCKDALVVLVTNPVSKLIAYSLQQYPNLNIVGCGVTNDTLRVRNEMQKASFPYNSHEIFVIGEHDIEHQSVIRLEGELNTNDFDHSLSEEEKHKFIADLKLTQNNYILGKCGDIEYERLPLMYRSYFLHRLSHFLYNTQQSTAQSILEIILAYINEDRWVSVEVINQENTAIIGVPIRFRNGSLQYHPIKLADHPIVSYCSTKYKIVQ